jgi:predicted ribosome quality control (RQC) complex YloA/Tae2 family protein
MKIFPFEHYILDNIIKYEFIIGQNAKENWEIIDDADTNDMWLHIADYPSCHVVIKKYGLEEGDTENNINYPNQVIAIGADYCKEFSKYKDKKKVKIVYTLIKNVDKGRVIGSVNIKNEKYIFI